MADMVVTLSGDEAKLFRAQQKIIEQQAKLAAGYRDVGTAAKQTGNEAEKAAAKGTKASEATTGLGSAVSKLGASVSAVGTAFVAVNAAIAAQKQAMEDNIRLQERSLELALNLANAQSGASKNLTGLSSEKKKEAIATAKQIQAETGFVDQAAIVNAIGSGYSASGDMEKTISAVTEAAKITLASPGDLQTVAAGALDLAKGSGITDAKANIGFLLSAGKFARVEDPRLLAQNLAPTVAAGVNTVKNQDATEASREIGALFVELNQFANDVTGMSTKTATTTFVAKMGEFFEGLDKSRAEVDEKLRKKDKALSTARIDLAQSSVDISQAETELGKYAGVGADSPQMLKDKKQEAEIALQRAIARKSDLEGEVTALEADSQKLQAQKAGLGSAKDSGTVFGRIQELQSNAELRDLFLANPFGEVAFQGGFREILTSGSKLAGNINTNKAGITFDAATFQQEAQDSSKLTPEISVAVAKAKQSAINELNAQGRGDATIATLSQITQNTLLNTRGLGRTRAADVTAEYAADQWFGDATTIEESLRENQARLLDRAESINTQIKGAEARGEKPSDDLLKAMQAIEEANRRMVELTQQVTTLMAEQNNKVDNQTEVIQSQQSTPNQIRASVQDGRNR